MWRLRLHLFLLSFRWLFILRYKIVSLLPGYCMKEVLHWSIEVSKLWLGFYMLTPWCSGIDYCTSIFNKTWNQVLGRFKSCSWHVGDSRWWGCLTMVTSGNKAKCLSLVNHTTKTSQFNSTGWILLFWIFWRPLFFLLVNSINV